MIKNLKQRMKDGDEKGFTLIELLVVVLILGILMAIAIPTFLSLTGGAKTSAAEADLTTAAQDEAAYLTQNGAFDATTADTTVTQWNTANTAAMVAADSGINWVSPAGATDAPGTAGTKSVAINVSSGSSTAPVLTLVTKGSDGNLYWVKDTNGALTYAWTVGTITPWAAGPTAGDFVSAWKSLPSTASAS